MIILMKVVMPAMAASEANSEILLKRVVVASLDEKGKLQLNVTWVNQTINLGNMSCTNSSCCSCGNDTCPVTLYSVDVNEVYNVSEKGETLKLLNVTVYNESFSYSFHVLAYQVEKEQYNLTVVTRIVPVNDTNLFTTMVNIDPRDDKAQPVADVAFFKNKTTLAEHYRLLGKVLNEVRKNDNTSWIWNKARIELNELAKKVERDLAEYNVDGMGIATILDGETVCSAYLNPLIELRLECRTSSLPPDWLAIAACCGVFYGSLITCAGVCGKSLGILCSGCILAAIGGTTGTCWSVCPEMDLCAYSLEDS